jgi:aryl-alcohol dehydrogenase-like predicted oxidoreductase
VEYRQLGKSGLRVSAFALGTMGFGGTGIFRRVGSVDIAGATRQLDMCRDAGVNLVDTADGYSAGGSEEILGAALRGRRNDFLISTKVRFPTGKGPNDAGLSRLHLIEACEASLRRLGTDHIDIYQVHEWDGHTPVEETLDTLDGLVRAGKVRYIGCSNYTSWQMMKSLAASRELGVKPYTCQQIHYSLAARDAEYELVPIGLDQGVGILVWGPLAGGLLTGKFRRDEERPKGARHSETWDEPPIRDWERLWNIVDIVVDTAAAHNVSPAQVALAYIMGKPGVSSVIVGARTEAQLADTLGAADLELEGGERERLDKASELPLLYPHWHQARNATDRLAEPELTLLRQFANR